MDASHLLPIVARLAQWSDVAAAWLLTYALHSTVCIGAAWVASTYLRTRWSPAAQATLWRSALLAGCCTATVQVTTAWRPLGGELRLPAATHATITAVQLDEGRSAFTRFAATRLTFAPAPLPMPPATTDVPFRRMMIVALPAAALAVAAWGVLTLCGLIHLLWIRRRLEVVLSGRQDATASAAWLVLRHLQREGGVHRAVRLSVTERLTSPAALAGDEIILPGRAMRELSLAEQEAIIAHELAHVARRDTRWLQLAMCLERLAWFQPLNRIARERMQLAAEFAADVWAVRVVGDPLVLARALARVAAWRSTARRPGATTARGSTATVSSSAMAMAGAAWADGSPLLERVRRLTAPIDVRRTWDGGRAHLVLVVASLVALLALPRVDLAVRSAATGEIEERVELHLTGAPGWSGRPAGLPRSAKAAVVLLRRRGGVG